MKQLIFLTIAILFFSCESDILKEQKTENDIKKTLVTLTEAQYKNAEITTEKPVSNNISTIIKVNGKIDVPPQNMISVSMPLGGYLKTTKLLPGMHVSKGEVIATMEDLQYIQLQQEYLTTKTKLQFSETEFLRQKELNQSKASSDKAFQQTQMEYNSYKIELNALAEKLKLININSQNLSENTISKNVNIVSPIDGFVSKVNVNIGKYVNPADILFELVNTSDIHLNLKVFEKDIDKLSIGQAVITYNNQSSKKYNCEIILISQDLSKEGTLDVHCHFNDYDKSLLPGMYMNAEIKVNTNNVLSIHEDAIVSFEGKYYIFVEKGNRLYELVEIKKGIIENDYCEISLVNGNNLSNYTIVAKGAYSLLMQLKNTSED